MRSCFFFNDTATTEIYTLSLHDALPIFLNLKNLICRLHGESPEVEVRLDKKGPGAVTAADIEAPADLERSEEHTSELQSRQYLVCRLLLEKKKQTTLQSITV